MPWFHCSMVPPNFWEIGPWNYGSRLHILVSMVPWFQPQMCIISFQNDNVLHLDKKEFLFLLNLVKSNRVRKVHPELPDQDFLNEVYLWDKFDIGTEYNTCASVMDRGLHSLMDNATIFHFSGPEFKPDKCNMKKSLQPLCDKWKHYRQKLPWEQNIIS